MRGSASLLAVVLVVATLAPAQAAQMVRPGVEGPQENDSAFSHPICTASSARPQSRNPRCRPSYTSGFAQSAKPNLRHIWARAPRSSSFADPKDDGSSLLIDTVEGVLDQRSFQLSSRTVVLTDGSTELIGVESVAALGPGDLVQIRGQWRDDGLHASVVERLQRAEPPVEVSGSIAFLAPEVSAFGLHDGTYGILDEHTQFVHTAGLHDLTVGDTVTIAGTLDRWTRVMHVIRLERTAVGETAYTLFRGTVAAVMAPERIVLASGAEVHVGASAILDNFGGVADLAPGDVLWVEAETTALPGYFEALSLHRIAVERWPVSFVGTVASVDADGHLFTTLEGSIVDVDDDTDFTAVDGLAALTRGDMVLVDGTASNLAPTVIEADAVELLAIGGGGAGLRTALRGRIKRLVGPDRFELDDGAILLVDAATAWLGNLDGPNDLEAGMLVEAVVEWRADATLRAVSVAPLDPTGAGLVEVEGILVVQEPSTWRHQLDNGEWIIIEPSTPVDGDVDSVRDISPGMRIVAQCVVTAFGELRALHVDARVATASFPWSLDLLEATEAMVVLVPGARPDEVAGRHGAVVAGRLPGTLVHLFLWPVAVTEVEVEELVADPEIEEVEPNYSLQDAETVRRRMILVDRKPSSGAFTKQAAVPAIALPGAHQRTTGAGTTVAVIDTGVDPLHPLLRHRIKAGGWDFVDDDGTPWETRDGIDQDEDGDVDEAAGHGTFVSGLVLLAAPATSILPYRVLDDDGHGTTFAVCQALLAAINRGADVINMSFATYEQRSRVLDRILDEAYRRGIVLVSGAGNDGFDGLPFPASDRHVLAVAAVNADTALAGFSNFGQGVSIAAPGQDLYSGGIDGVFGTWSGTSMAAPLVSGAAALLRSVNPYLGPFDVAAALVQSSAAISGENKGVSGMLQVGPALDLVPDSP